MVMKITSNPDRGDSTIIAMATVLSRQKMRSRRAEDDEDEMIMMIMIDTIR